MQAAAARFADANLLGERPVGLKLKLGEDAGEIDTRPELRRQDIDFETERPEPGFNTEMPRRQPAIARALVIPIGLLRGGDEAWMARVLQLLGQPVGDLVHFPQYQHVDVLHGNIALAAECAGGDALHQHDNALAIGRNALGRLRPARVRRESVERRRTGNADEVGAQFPGAAFNLRGIKLRHVELSSWHRTQKL